MGLNFLTQKLPKTFKLAKVAKSGNTELRKPNKLCIDQDNT